MSLLLALAGVGVLLIGGSATPGTHAHFHDTTNSTGTIGTAEAFPHFLVTIDGTNSLITEGEQLEVTATIENNGSVPAEQEVELHVEGQNNPVDSAVLEIQGYDTQQYTFTWQTEEGDGGNGRSSQSYDVTVISEDDSATEVIQVQGSGGGGGGGNGNVVTADAGGPYEVDEGNGNSVTLDASGSSTSSGNLNGGQAGYQWEILDDGPGSLQPPTDQETVTYTPPNDVTEDTTVTVKVTVTNNKGDTDTDTAEITIFDRG